MTNDRYTSLPRTARADTITVRSLIDKVQRGEVRVPNFQRPLRWRAGDVRLLFDSIYRGYPIGSLLMWRQQQPAARVKVAWTTVDAAETTQAWLVVDGQQRVTALAGALSELSGRERAEARPWQLYFDTRNEEFVSGTPSEADRESCVPMVTLGDLRRLGRWARDCDPDAAALDRAAEAQRRILDYEIPLYIVESDDESALRGAFARINSTGARMRADEVFHALFHDAATGSFDLTALGRVCEQQGFGVPPRSELLKVVLAVSGLEPTRRPERLAEQDLRRVAAQVDVENALMRAVDFMRDWCGVPHARAIPYPVVMFILAKWFHAFPDTDDEALELLRRWFWRGAMSGAHARAAVSKMRNQVAIIPDADRASMTTQREALLAMLGEVGREPPRGTWELEAFNHRSGRSRVETLALLSLSPRASEGEVLDGGLLFHGERAAREVFPVAGSPARSLFRTAANRVLLDEAATSLADVIRMWEGPAFAAHRRSHLISDAAFDALTRDDADGFLRERSADVRKVVASFVSAKCRWDETDVFPAAWYSDDVD